MKDIKTVGDYICKLRDFPENWPVIVSTTAGGGISIEHREIQGNPVVAIFGANGGRFGETPLTEGEYRERSAEVIEMWKNQRYRYTSIHGDHRLYIPGGRNDTCYGKHFDRRVIERMVAEGLIAADQVDIERVRRCET